MGKVKAALITMGLGALGTIIVLRLVPGASSAAKVVSTNPTTK